MQATERRGKFLPNLESLLVPIDKLHVDPANVRLHPERSINAIAASLARFGQQKPIERRVLARYCIATSLWHRTVDDIAKHGMIYTVRSKDSRLAAVREMPAAKQVRALEAMLRACELTLRDYLVSSGPFSSRSKRR